MALGQYRIKVVPVLDTASLHKQLEAAGTQKSGSMGKAGEASGATYANGFSRAIKERFKYSIANALIYGSEAAMKDVVANVKELDKAQTEFKKVSDLSGKALENYTEQAFKAGKTVAKTGTQMVQAATEFRKSGFGDSDSLKLAKIASMYQNVADVELTAGEAANFIVSQIKAFNMEAGDAEHIIDAVNAVSNKFAVSSADIATNIGKASAAMATGNVTYEQSIGLMTAMTEITRSGTKAARGLVTIQSRFNQIVDESSSTGKKLTAWYKEHNIAIKDQNGQLRSFYDVASQVSEKWDTLSENEKRYYLNIQAGANQSQNLAALMRNFGTAIEATNTAMKDNGSAARENAKYLDSIEGHMQSLISAWENLSHHLMDSSTLKGLIDIGTDIINVIDKIVTLLDRLPGKLGAVVGIAGVAEALIGGKKLFNIVTGLTGVGKAVEGIGDAAEVASGATKVGGLSKALSLLTNPVVLAGLATLVGTLALLKLDDYLSLEGSTERLSKYEKKLGSVTSQIEKLKEKRDSDEGLTDAEKTHLAVLEAEERSLKRQVELEKQRVKEAFQRDTTSTRNKKDEAAGRSGPTELLSFNDALSKQVELYNDIAKVRRTINELESTPSQFMTPEKYNLLEKARQQLTEYESDWTEVTAKTASAGAELSAYWENVKDNVPYEELDARQQKVYDDLHKAFLQNQIDVDNLKDGFSEVSGALDNLISGFGLHGLINFDDIDISKLQTTEDLIAAIKEQISNLDDDAEITFTATDDTGAVLGNIQAKKSDFTDEEWNIILKAQTTGDWSEVEKLTKGKNKKDNFVKVFGKADFSNVKKEKKDAEKDVKIPVKFDKPTGTKAVEAKRTAYGKPITTYVNYKIGTTPSPPIRRATGKRRGQAGGLAWLGDEGSASNPKPELVVGENGAYLAGTRGWELYTVKDSDTVYTYAQTKKLLGERQSFSDIEVDELPRFKKGKKKKKKKKQSKQDQINAALANYDETLEQMKHYLDTDVWDEAGYINQYTALYNSFLGYLDGDRKRAYEKALHDYRAGLAKKEIERSLGLVGVGAMTSAQAVNAINAQGALSAEEKRDYRAQAYQTSVEYNLKEYQNGKDTRQNILNDIKAYYNTRGQYDATYYKMLDDLRNADQKKEVERLNELSKNEENKLSYLKQYAQRQKDYYDEQIDKENEEVEELEKLVDLQEKLNNAKKTMVRVYREGVGFVYEQDTKAVREAQKALDDYNKEHQKSDLEKKADEWQAILDLIGDLEDLSGMKELELLLGIGGISDITGGDIGTDITKWTELVKGIISAGEGYKDLANVLSKATGTDIEALIGATLSGGGKQVSAGLIANYLAKHSFASGTLNSPSGFSIIGEHGAELGWLNKGSTILPHSISKNLMEWGEYSPAEILNGALGAMQNAVFNFDKIVLPNVSNAEEFYKELKTLPNKALQQSTLRI